jgi:hypothetical protein
MTNIQATHLPVGARIRRKGAADGTEIYHVERVERPMDPHKDTVIVHAGGHAFRAWEIDRIDRMWGWPKGPAS